MGTRRGLETTAKQRTAQGAKSDRSFNASYEYNQCAETSRTGCVQTTALNRPFPLETDPRKNALATNAQPTATNARLEGLLLLLRRCSEQFLKSRDGMDRC